MRHSSSQKHLFPWREDCRFELLVDGVQFFPRMLEAIHHAHHFILFENYLIESCSITNDFIQALLAARQRGVAVKLLFDDYGAKGLNIADRQRLIDSGVELVLYNPLNIRRFYRSLYRDHRKVLIIDGITAFSGGAGITDEFAPPKKPTNAWHDVMVLIQGPVVHDWMEVFMHTWKACTDRLIKVPDIPSQHYSEAQLGRVAVSKGPHLQEINRDFIKRIRSAERQVWLMTPYFVPARKIRRALKRAARQDVDVRLLLPGPISDHPWVSHAARGFYHRLLRQGVRIFECQTRFPHAKIELCDNWVSLGSSNLDRWNQRWSMDANQEVDSTEFAEQVRQMFVADFAESQEITLDAWNRRAWYQRLQQWFWGRFVMLLERLGRNYKK